MKLARIGSVGAEVPAIIDSAGRARSLSGHVEDITPLSLAEGLIKDIRGVNFEQLPILDSSNRIGSCIAWVPNFWCVGLNYADHVRETGAPMPLEPVIFNKSTGALSGPNDDVIRPPGSTKLDYEVELAVIIGHDGYNIPEENALEWVAGYCIVNDVSERSFQKDRGGQWVKGKSSPTFAPTGPWLVTPDEVGDVNNLNCSLKVNQRLRQQGSTSDMIFSVAQIISYLSQFTKLLAGDIISTGTTSGVALGMNPQQWLVPGDVVEVGVEKLGYQCHKVVEYEHGRI